MKEKCGCIGIEKDSWISEGKLPRYCEKHRVQNKPTVIKSDPGIAVDRHWKRFGHLPTSDLCDEKGSCLKSPTHPH